MKRNTAAGGALLHPAALSALAVLVLNDHVLKHVCPGIITGKLSDFAGVLFLPIFLHALVELGAARLRRQSLGAASNRALLGCVAISLIAFALPEVWPPAELAYRYGLGALRWPFQALAAVVRTLPAPGLRPVRATADITDLLALPMGLLSFRVARQPAAVTARDSAQVSAVSHST